MCVQIMYNIMNGFVNYDDVDENAYNGEKTFIRNEDKNDYYLVPYKKGEISFIVKLMYFAYIINLFDKYINELSK